MFATSKKFLVAGVAAITVAGAALAFANTLTVTSDDLGSGTSGVATPACSPDAEYTTAWDGTAKEFEVTKVTVTATGCGTDDLVQVALVGGTTSLWDSGAAVALSSTGVHTFDVSDGVDAADVTDVYVSVNGEPAA